MDRTLAHTDCIVLAGGKGTRLRTVITEVPKPMAPINGVPFLELLLKEFHQQGIQQFVLATGYKTEVIQAHFKSLQKDYAIRYSIEDEPLGTGGAIQKAMYTATTDKVLVVNGDSFFGLSLKDFYLQTEGIHTCALALKKIANSDRYGSVRLQGDKITQFEEKIFRASALINAGVYLIDRTWFLSLGFPEKFSFEKDFLEVYAQKGMLYGFEAEGYFIDIGIPADYRKAQSDLK